MSKDNEAEKGRNAIEEKIDLLVAESEKATLERKRDRILSKVDGLYNVLIALSTFLVGLVISQHGFFVKSATFGIFFSITGLVLSMIVSYTVGFVGMIKDSIETRILSWGLFLTSLTILGISYLIPFFTGNDFLSIFMRTAIGLVIAFVLFVFSSLIVTFLESKLSTIVGQETHEWAKIKKRVTFRVAYISVVIFGVTFLISFFVAIYIGMF
jgi:hypothetical protein